MNTMVSTVSTRAGRGLLALVLLLGLTLWVGGGVELASAITQIDYVGSPTAFLQATQGDNYTFKYVNDETQIQRMSDTLHGILDVTTITATASNGTQTIWFGDGGSGGGQLTGQFDSLTVDTITPNGSGAVVNFSGGEMALYNVPDSTFSPDAGGPGNPALDICGGACPLTPWATANFASGIDNLNAGVTLSSNLTQFSPPIGVGAGYLDTGMNGFGTGAENGLLNHQGESTSFGARDLLLTSVLCPSSDPNCGSNSTSWPVYSNDPVVNPVPEPASAVLVGAGLGALGLWRRMARAPKA